MSEVKEFYCPNCGHKLNTEVTKTDKHLYLDVYCMYCNKEYRIREEYASERLTIEEYKQVTDLENLLKDYNIEKLIILRLSKEEIYNIVKDKFVKRKMKISKEKLFEILDTQY